MFRSPAIGCDAGNSEGQNTMIDNQMAGPRATTRIVGAAVALAISGTAYGRTFHDASGRVTGHSRTDSRGVTTFYDSSNRITGRARTGVNGTTTFYDASGRVTGRSR
jgi:YD repeat-containing protein